MNVWFFEGNPRTELLPERMHLAENINVRSEALAHHWLRIFVNGVLGKSLVCFSGSHHYLKNEQ